MKYSVVKSEGFIPMWWNFPETQHKSKILSRKSDAKKLSANFKNSMLNDTSKHRQSDDSEQGYNLFW